MKKFLIATVVIAMFSCKKNAVNESSLNNLVNAATTDSATSTLHRNTKFGVLVNGTLTMTKRISVAKNLNAPYVRNTISMDQWTGSSGPYENYVKNGLKVILNITNTLQTSKPRPFATDLTAYRNNLVSITNKYQPEVVVIENEEINKNYYYGPITNYIAMLNVALSVCHAKGIKVTNGGIYGGSLEILTYRYLQTKSQKRADSFGNNCMYPYQVKAAQNPNSNPTLEQAVRQMDTLLNFYHNLDYVNIHPYEPLNPNITSKSSVTSATPVVIPDIQEYLMTRTGKPVMTNETGQRDNTSPDLVTSVLKEYDYLNFPYALWYSGDGNSGAKPLHNLTTGALYSNGDAYSNFMATY